MLIRTNIYNRNYYPIRVYNLNERILQENKKDESEEWYINQTTFDNHIGDLIKPFQDIELLTSISLVENEKEYNGHLYLDSTIRTDSIDYGTFGIITGLAVDIKHHYVSYYTFNNGITLCEEIVNNLEYEDYIEVKFNMKSISDLKLILDHILYSGFTGYSIEKFDFIGDGVYNTTVMKEDECTSPFTRSSVLMPLYEIKELLVEPTAKLEVYKTGDDVWFSLYLPSTSIVSLYDKICGEYNDAMKDMLDTGDVPDEVPLPLFQLPLGMTVVLGLETKHGSTPYKLNLKISNPIFIFAPYPADENAMEEAFPEIKPIKNLIQYPMSTNMNTLLCSPTETKILSNPLESYNGHIKLIPYSFKQFGDHEIKDLKFSINNIYLKNNDSEISNGNLSFITETLPTTKLIPQEESIFEDYGLDVFIDTTNINEEYNNSLIVEYTYDGTSTSLETDINIYPILPMGEAVITNYGGIFCEDSHEFIYTRGTQYNIIPYEKVSLSPFSTENIQFSLVNVGSADCIIDKIELENAAIYLDELSLITNPSEDTILNIETLQDYINAHNDAISITKQDVSSNKYTSAQTLNEDEYKFDPSPISDTISYKTLSIDMDTHNSHKSNIIKVAMEIDKFAASKNVINGIPIAVKVTYRTVGNPIKKEVYLAKQRLFSLKYITAAENIGLDKSISRTKYIRPNAPQTLYLTMLKYINYPVYLSNQMQNDDNFGINIVDASIINFNNEDTNISDTELNMDSKQFPMSLSSTANSSNFVKYDVKLNEEKLYSYKLRLHTTHRYIPFVDIPMNIAATNIDVEEVIKFDTNDFYVRNNKYFLSLIKLQEKNRKLTIVNTSDVPLNILEIKQYVLYDKFGTENFEMEITNNQPLPIVLTNTNNLQLDVNFLGKDFGHYSSFIILTTDMGEVLLHIAAFVNTKYKDVYVMMENRKGTSFTAPLNGADIDYIKLTNFGDDISLLETTKLGYDQSEFLLSNVKKIMPNSINYIENIFVPTSTGQKIGLVDFKIRDMLETYKLLDSEDQYIYKIQNSHILAEMFGVALTDHAMPYFSKSVVDFGYVAAAMKDRVVRVDTFDIKNLGLSPFIITKITKTDPKSPFEIPLIEYTLPIKVDKEISLPIYVNNKLFTDNQKVYMDVLNFEIQDLKSKHIFNYEMIVKIELTEENREYMSFNSEFIEFGYCEINHFKTDDLLVKNFSTDKVNVAISYEGDHEIQTLESFNFNLWPNQKFNIPIYFYPHGIDSFEGKMNLNFNNGNYIKDIDLFGLGVDFKSPLIKVENKMAEYYTTLKDYLGNNKYI